MFERGEKLWLCLSFYKLPLEALSTKPLEVAASGDTEAPDHPSLDKEPLESLAFSIKPLGAAASSGIEALHHPPGTEGVGATARERPVAVLEKQRVLVCNEAAAELGIKAGMGTTTARALAESILLLERDPGAEQRRLQQLCCWGYSISPTLYPYRDDCLLLEIGSCLRLYGNIEVLLARVESGLSRREVHYRAGLGPTPKSAFLFTTPLEANASDSSSEALDHPSVSESGERAPQQTLQTASSESGGESLEARLAPLPLSLLEDFPCQMDALAKAGLRTFGDILALPRRALARRCGREFVLHLEQILGTVEDRQPGFEPPRTFGDDYWFGYEVKTNQELLPAVELLLKSFCHFLRNTQLETRQVEWLLYGINRKIHRFALHSSQPQTHWQAWYQLTRLKIEQLELDHSIEGVGLASEQLVLGNACSGSLFQQAGQKEPMHSLLDRLRSRLGPQSVSKIACRDEHLPEFAGYCSPDTWPGTATGKNDELRPFWLMQEPQPLQVFNGQPCWQGRLKLLDGPERIEDNWWEQPVSRDYYVARGSHGQLYWVYRDRLQNQWYMQGVFN